MPALNRPVEWPTLVMLGATYALWALGTTWFSGLWLPLGVVVTAIAIAQFSSLQHEALHGHPFASRAWNEALVFPGLTLFIPYGRFRDTHLAHHHDPILTDPYDDPESNFLDPEVWARMPVGLRALRRFNNSLAGRMIVGPAISIHALVVADLAAIRAGDRGVRKAWALHAVGLVPVIGWIVAVGAMPGWAYVAAAYAGFGLLKIRTFLEHRAHETPRARSVVVEDRGPLALLFLNNNFHSVHHAHPGLAWYRLPGVYRAHRDDYLRRNDGYRYASYAEVFGKYLFRTKDPVPHPIWRKR